MKRLIIIFWIFFGFKTPTFSQSNIYIGTGLSFLKLDWCCVVQPLQGQERMLSYNVSIMSKSDVSKNLAISLGIIYNVNRFEAKLNGVGFNPVLEAYFSRYAIPLRLHWKAYRSIYINGGIMLNNLFRKEYKKFYGENEVWDYSRPDVNFIFGIGGEWKRFLLDVGMAHNFMEPQVVGHDHYWTIDFNVYYRILSSGKE